MLTNFRRHALAIARDNPGISGQDFAALVWPDNIKKNPQGLARMGSGLLIKLANAGLIQNVSDGWRECVGSLTPAGRQALEASDDLG